MTVTTKHPMKIGSTLLPKGSKGETAGIDDEIKETFPNITIKPDSAQIAVKFDDLPRVCIVHRNQLNVVTL